MDTIPFKLRIRFLVQQQESLDRLCRIEDVHGTYLRLIAAAWRERRGRQPRLHRGSMHDDETTPTRRMAG